MGKKWRRIAALLLCLLLLCGCGGGDGGKKATLGKLMELSLPEEEPRRTVPFGEMVYTRPDPSALEALLEQVRQALEQGDYAPVEALLDEFSQVYEHCSTMESLSYIHSSLDMTDPYWAEEYAYCAQQTAELSRLLEQLYYACGMSPMAGELEENYFWEGFAEEYADDSQAIYDEETVALYQREADLITRYRELIASPTITLSDGTEADYYSRLSEGTEEEYYDALVRFYLGYNQPLGEIYLDLIRVRREIAEKRGYDSYEQLQFEEYWERDYSPEQALDYIARIKEQIVPLYREISLLAPYRSLRSDSLSQTRLNRILESGVDKMGGEMTEAFAFMSQYGVYDIRLDPRKLDSSFETYLEEYDTPFLFLNPTGSTGDITTFAHEFGHFTDAYVNDNAYETIDVAEIYSQALEYLMLCNLDGILGQAELENLRKMKLLDTLDMLVQQASFASFEHQVYALSEEELTVESLNAISLQVSRDFGYYDDWLDFYYARSWIDIVHFFEMPFYVITYPVSNDIALQLYELELAQPGAGLARYRAMLPREGEGMLELAESAGLRSPFEPERIGEAAQLLRGFLLPAAA